MPITTRHLRIRAPVEEVWAVLIDVPGQPRWMRDLGRLQLEDDGPLRVGSRAVGTVTMFGLSQTDPIEVTALDPPTRYAIRHLGAFTGWGEFRLWPIDGGAATQVRWREELRPTPGAFPLVPRLGRLPVVGPAIERAARLAARCLDPLLWPVFTAVFRADLRRLRRLVETGSV
jgi:uncharacterized protein YndB with AHSA1/START domain